MKFVDTRPLFRPLCTDIVRLLRSLSPGDWHRTAVAGEWLVRDVAAHVLDTALRRLSFHRDGLTPPGPDTTPSSDRDFVRFINALNAEWVRAARRLSPRVLTDLYEHACLDLADFVEAVPPDAPPLFPVSWAGESGNTGWFDIGREFTEIWHHGAQIRDAVGAGPFAEPGWLHAVLEIALCALPHAFRDVGVPVGTSLRLDISGPSGGAWSLRRADDRWTLGERSDAAVSGAVVTIVEMTDETAWRVLFNGLTDSAVAERVHVIGDRGLAGALFRARAVIV